MANAAADSLSAHQRHQRLQQELEAVIAKMAVDSVRLTELDKELGAVKAKLPSPWVSTAASAATAIGMTVLSNGSAGVVAGDVPSMIMGEIRKRFA